MMRCLVLLAAFIASGSSFSLPRSVGVSIAKRPSRTSLFSESSDAKVDAAKKVAYEKESNSEYNRNQHQYYSLDLGKTVYTNSMKTPKDAYIVYAEKGANKARLPKRKIFHQSLFGGFYVGFGALLSFSVAGNIPGIAATNPGLVQMAFASLFPVFLLFIITTQGQLFTGNTAVVAAARYEGLVDTRQFLRALAVSLAGNVLGCALMALTAWYVGLLTGGTAELCVSTAISKCESTYMANFIKAILCNWMVSLALFLGRASNDLAGKLVACWFPISTFVAIGLEHSVATFFVMPAALLLKAPLSLANILLRSTIPVILGNAVAGTLVVAGSYSYQFGRLGGKHRAAFAQKLKQYEAKKKSKAAAAPEQS